MSNAETDSSVPLSWIVVFLLLVLGLGAAVIVAVGGGLVAGGAGVLTPLLG
ncbi:hypothetical protein [Halorarius halobius]|uniref:hypothetical protein n=1 Tax=Halorarius halobius TaxID=2962671 RepID=UPI0020CD7F4A|nr:hypothetical protein [Halorarius halobius]